MCTNGANISANSTTTSSAVTQLPAIPSPRAFLLPWNEFTIWLEYYQYVTIHANKSEDIASRFREKIMKKMRPERMRKFPALVEEYAIFFAHREAQKLKESLEELVAELRLEVENDIDLERGRC